MRVTVAALAVSGALVVAGCDGDAGEPNASATTATTAATPSIASTVLHPPRLTPGQPVPTPAAAAALTLTGRIGRPNAGRTLRLDIPTIDAVGLRRVTLYEPWVKRRMSFRGVWLADLLRVAGVDPDAQVVHLTALDDYVVDLRMSEVAAGGIFLATATGDGAPIPVGDGGPTRIVFVGDVASGRNADRWIWSLETLEVR